MFTESVVRTGSYVFGILFLFALFALDAFCLSSCIAIAATFAFWGGGVCHSFVGPLFAPLSLALSHLRATLIRVTL